MKASESRDGAKTRKRYLYTRIQLSPRCGHSLNPKSILKGVSKMAKPEIVIGDLKIVRIDSLNWQVYELREVGKAHRGNSNREGETDWMPLPAFFGTIKSALKYAKQLNRSRNLDVHDLDAAVQRIAYLDAQFIDAMERALKSGEVDA